MVIITLGPRYSIHQLIQNREPTGGGGGGGDDGDDHQQQRRQPRSINDSTNTTLSSHSGFQPVPGSGPGEGDGDDHQPDPATTSPSTNPSSSRRTSRTPNDDVGDDYGEDEVEGGELRSGLRKVSSDQLECSAPSSSYPYHSHHHPHRYFYRPYSLSHHPNYSHSSSASDSTLQQSQNNDDDTFISNHPPPIQQHRSMLSTGSVRTIGLKSTLNNEQNTRQAQSSSNNQSTPTKPRSSSSSSSQRPKNNTNNRNQNKISKITTEGTKHCHHPHSSSSSSSSSSTSSSTSSSSSSFVSSSHSSSSHLSKNPVLTDQPAFERHQPHQSSQENPDNRFNALFSCDQTLNLGSPIESADCSGAATNVPTQPSTNESPGSLTHEQAPPSDLTLGSNLRTLLRRDENLSYSLHPEIKRPGKPTSSLLSLPPSSTPPPPQSILLLPSAMSLASSPRDESELSLAVPQSPTQRQRYGPSTSSTRSLSARRSATSPARDYQPISQNSLPPSQLCSPSPVSPLALPSEVIATATAPLVPTTNNLPWRPSDLISGPLNSQSVMMPTINSFHHRPSIASVIREKRLRASLAQMASNSSQFSKMVLDSVSNISAPQSVPIRLQTPERKSRSRGCTRMGGLSDLNMNACFDTFQRPPLRRMLSENSSTSTPRGSIDSDPFLGTTNREPSRLGNVKSKLSGKNTLQINSDSTNSLALGLGEVVMTPTTEEWWTLDRLSGDLTQFHNENEMKTSLSSDGPQEDDQEDEAEDVSDESGSSCSTDRIPRSPSTIPKLGTQSTDSVCHLDLSRPDSSNSPQPHPTDSTTSFEKDVPAGEGSDTAALSSEIMDSSMEITPAGVRPSEPEPPVALPTLESVNGIIHMPPTPKDEIDVRLGNGDGCYSPTLLLSSQPHGCSQDQVSSPTRLSAAILNSILENGQQNPNCHLLPSSTPRPCSLSHDGVVRKPIDPRSYSAMTGNRSIHSFALESEAGKGAYGIVKNAREKGPDGQPTGPPLMIKYIIKQKILADCWKRHKILGPIPIEIHVLDHLRRVNYRPSRVAMAKKYIEENLSHEESKELKFIPHKPDSVIPHTDPSSPTNPTSQRTGHPNICGILDYFEDPDYYYMVMPRFGKGKDLFEHVENSPEGLPIEEVRRIFSQLADGLAFLHERNVVHRDLKDENVILDEEGNAQLIDFGSAAYVREGMKFETFSGTLDFAAPEVLRGERHDGKEIDIWALGVLLYVLICGECPFWNPEEASQGIEPGTRAKEALNRRTDIDSAAIDLLDNCLKLDPVERPSVEEICWHVFLVGEGGWRGLAPPTVTVPVSKET